MIICCDKCGKEFDREPYKVQRAKNHFCSRKCHNAKFAYTASFPDLTSRQAEILTGSLLGDGSLPTIKNCNCFFSKPQKADRKEYISWCYDELTPYSRRIYEASHLGIKRLNGKIVTDLSKSRTSCTLYCSMHPVFTALRKQWYPEGKKIVPKDIALTPLTLAVWFADDGSCSSRDKRRVRISTNGFSIEDVEVLIAKLSSTFGIMANYNLVDGKPVIAIPVAYRGKFFDIIAPHFIWNCFQYKLPENIANGTTSRGLS